MRIILAIGITLGLASILPGPQPEVIKPVAPSPESLTRQLELEQRQRAYDEAENVSSRVLKTHGCDDEYAERLSHAALDHKLPVRIVTALLIVESSCRPGVVSSEGAVGLMQVVPTVWHVPAEQLKDPTFNITKGTEILASYVKAHGLREGLHRYNGLGVGCTSCPGELYPNKVIEIAAR